MKAKSRPTTLGRHRANGRLAEPTWEIATLFPNPGQWSEGEYLALNTNHLVELSHGWIEVLGMPVTSHQRIVAYLYTLLSAFADPKLGSVLFAPLRVRLWQDKFREPDIVFMLKRHQHRIREEYWEGADLIMEVVSPDPEDRNRDLVIKRAEYARAGIQGYWIVDPKLKQITVLTLRGKKYQVAGEYKKGKAASQLLADFSVDVASVFSRT
jgi:Uma2 family endonuclease